ncbi:hypothetical protein L211DRAFT_853465 [Terfezia boudieri ATCC MYA-4762]|uniref:Uncharacterized protein n=1 Tax=Terfezia boudieri ATCC MYA-4762 TaxID=1051890 RepID=A0A3N4LMM2_9PEZI|nr:hypothetical protein L211DRAFT_853465 [Terfezia boudieri ATCC MYA-4762]
MVKIYALSTSVPQLQCWYFSSTTSISHLALYGTFIKGNYKPQSCKLSKSLFLMPLKVYGKKRRIRTLMGKDGLPLQELISLGRVNYINACNENATSSLRFRSPEPTTSEPTTEHQVGENQATQQSMQSQKQTRHPPDKKKQNPARRRRTGRRATATANNIAQTESEGATMCDNIVLKDSQHGADLAQIQGSDLEKDLAVYDELFFANGGKA